VDWPFLIALSVFATCVLAMVGTASYYQDRVKVQQWRGRIEGSSQARSQLLGACATLLQRVLTLVQRVGHVTMPTDEGESSRLRHALITAGFRSPLAPIIFSGTRFLLVILLPVVFFLFRPSSLTALPVAATILVVVTVAFLGLYAPNLWLQMSIERRKERIQQGLPDVLDLMVVCVEAGLGLDAAINRVGEEIRIAHKDLSDEIRLLALELRTGLSRQQALRNLSHRIDQEEVKSLVALLIQTDRFGTSVGQALRVHSDSMRKRRHLRAEEKAAKLPVKLLFPLMVFIFPTIFIVILGPAVINVTRVLLPALSK
jgi:tight adherence protein C